METEKPLISVIVPVYNGETYLAACIGSIEKQTYPNLEIIIINDGSTDETGRVCMQLQEIYGNIKVITMEDEGVSAARNAGLKAISGDYVTFVDADDRLRSGMLYILYDCLIKTESDVAGCRFFTWENEAEWQKYSDEKTAGDHDEIPELFTADTYIRNALLKGNSRCWSKLYRSRMLDKVRFREGLSIGEDMLFLLDVISSAGKVAETQYPGYGYFQNPNGAIKRRFTPRYMDQITCWEIAREKIGRMSTGEDLYAQATTILIMGIMLTVGKIACLSAAERNENGEYIEICHKKLKEALCVPGAYKGLSAGYRLKVKLFSCAPGLYLFLYHMKKTGRNG